MVNLPQGKLIISILETGSVQFLRYNSIMTCTCVFMLIAASFVSFSVSARSSPLAPRKPLSEILVSDRTYCGYQHRDDRFDNSENATLDEFPWLVLVIHSAAGSEFLYCLGVLLNNRYVLTSAVCASWSNETSVRLGGYNVNSAVDCVPFFEDDECSTTINIGVENFISHPDFTNNPGSASEIHFNIALIRLAKTITYSDYIRPICLPDSNFKAQIGTNMTFTGWGEHDIKLAIKEKRRGIIVPMRECIRSAKDWPDGILSEEHLICFRESDTKSCVSPIGGLLMSNKRFQWQIDGIFVVPIKENCQESPLAAYTNVTKHVAWIVQTIKP